MGLININKKKMKHLHLPQLVLNFFALVEDFFHPSSLIFDLESSILIEPQNHCFPIKLFGFIKNNITTDDNILAYKVIQYVPLSFFIIANEYAFDTFGI
jgi:hypothetical protein